MLCKEQTDHRRARVEPERLFSKVQLRSWWLQVWGLQWLDWVCDLDVDERKGTVTMKKVMCVKQQIFYYSSKY